MEDMVEELLGQVSERAKQLYERIPRHSEGETFYDLAHRIPDMLAGDLYEWYLRNLIKELQSVGLFVVAERKTRTSGEGDISNRHLGDGMFLEKIYKKAVII